MSHSPIPTPALLAKRPTLAQAQTQQVVAALDPSQRARPGLVSTVVQTIHTGEVRTKHLVAGQSVRPLVRGQAMGAERVVESITKIENGAFWRITWSTPHVPQVCKAAYRWHDESLVGSVVQTVVQKPGFVAYQEV